jgi:hypothetical protein
MNKITMLLIIGSISGLVFLSSTSQQAFAGGRAGFGTCWSNSANCAHKPFLPHGVPHFTPPPPTCNIDKYQHCSAPMVVCFTINSVLNNNGINVDVTRQILNLLHCS